MKGRARLKHVVHHTRQPSAGSVNQGGSNSVTGTAEPITIATGIPVFDGHNDTLLDLPLSNRSFFERAEVGHLDLPRAREGGLGGGFFACFVRDPEEAEVISEDGDDADATARATSIASRYTDPTRFPEPMSLAYAQREAMAMVARLIRLERESQGQAKIVRSAREIRECLEDGTFAMELHFEGAEAIDPEFDALEVYHELGLRSLGITWSRPNRFAHGVPFQFPASPDTGPGLTDLGKELVRQCNQLRIMIDLSHLNEAGFWDVARLSDAPLVATHSNAHGICAATRNLTDKQLDAIKASDGLVGLNYNCGFLSPTGERGSNLDLSVMVDHLDYLIARLGDDKVALGSDFDGATMPDNLKDVSLQQNLLQAMANRGYDEATIRKVAYGNWLRVLELTWGE